MHKWKTSAPSLVASSGRIDITPALLILPQIPVLFRLWLNVPIQNSAPGWKVLRLASVLDSSMKKSGGNTPQTSSSTVFQSTQQLKKASLPQQQLPGEMIPPASVSGSVTSSLMTLEAMLMAEIFCVSACLIPHPTVSWFGSCVNTVFSESRVRNQTWKLGTEKYFSLKKTPTAGMKTLFNPDQCTDLHLPIGKKELKREQTAGMVGGDEDIARQCPWRKNLWSCPAAIQDTQGICIAEHCHRIRISHFKSNHQLSPKFIWSTSSLPCCSCSSSS